MRFCMPTGMEEAEVMEARETELMLSLKFPNPYSDRIGMVHD